MSGKKELKTGVLQGGGPEPGYRWTVFFLSITLDEAHNLFTEDQYWHLVDQVLALAGEESPSHSQICEVQAVEDFLELKDKGGVLGKINVRIFFALDKRIVGSPAIVVLGVIKKENNGPTPEAVKIRIRRRLRKYLAGDYKSASG